MTRWMDVERLRDRTGKEPRAVALARSLPFLRDRIAPGGGNTTATFAQSMFLQSLDIAAGLPEPITEKPFHSDITREELEELRRLSQQTIRWSDPASVRWFYSLIERTCGKHARARGLLRAVGHIEDALKAHESGDWSRDSAGIDASSVVARQKGAFIDALKGIADKESGEHDIPPEQIREILVRAEFLWDP